MKKTSTPAPDDTAQIERRIWGVFGLESEDTVDGRWVGGIVHDGLMLDGEFTLEELEKIVAAWRGVA